MADDDKGSDDLELGWKAEDCCNSEPFGWWILELDRHRRCCHQDGPVVRSWSFSVSAAVPNVRSECPFHASAFGALKAADCLTESTIVPFK